MLLFRYLRKRKENNKEGRLRKFIKVSFSRCHKALEPKGINLTKIITEPDPKIYDNILNSFIGIAAVQIGLTDILKTIGIEPDFIIGKW